MAQSPRPTTRSLRFLASPKAGRVSAVLVRPPAARCLLVFAHGAGAGMHHAFMQASAAQLAQCGIASFRYQFPYMEQGGKRPNPGPVRSKRSARPSLRQTRRPATCRCSPAESRWAAA
ncbi:MAG: hypothetical protein J4F42_10420 [Desulfurellaceae bacterium]|nr:hypothetical protein [Desulfurellaceae bacterium]